MNASAIITLRAAVLSGEAAVASSSFTHAGRPCRLGADSPTSKIWASSGRAPEAVSTKTSVVVAPESGYCSLKMTYVKLAGFSIIDPNQITACSYSEKMT